MLMAMSKYAEIPGLPRHALKIRPQMQSAVPEESIEMYRKGRI